MPELKSLPKATQAPHRAALEAVRAELKTKFLERDSVVDGLLSAILCRQHVLVLGPPGSAKSAIASEVAQAITGSIYFQWLLTKFTTPEEIFGPVSLQALQQDKLSRITTGKLPEAHFSFIDETFKASSAILNAMLTLINERVFFNAGQAVKCPLHTVIGASNELPESEELEALYDRFLVRYWVPYIHDTKNVRKLLATPSPKLTVSMTLSDLELCQRETMAVKVSDTTINSLLVVKQKTEEAGFITSDRRWKQILELLKAFAYLEGGDEVSEDHLDILADCLWRMPKDRPALAAIVGQVGNPLNTKAAAIVDAAKEAVAQLGADVPKDPQQRSDWLAKAGMVESRLVDMETELTDIVSKNSERNLRKVNNALRTVTRHKTNLAKRVAEVFNLS